MLVLVLHKYVVINMYVLTLIRCKNLFEINVCKRILAVIIQIYYKIFVRTHFTAFFLIPKSVSFSFLLQISIVMTRTQEFRF